MTKYLLNAFSLQMVDVPCNVHFEEVDVLPDGLTSAIGHQDTASVLGVKMNRCNDGMRKASVVTEFEITKCNVVLSDNSEHQVIFRRYLRTW